LWFFVVAIILVRGVLQPNKNNCFYPCYWEGGLNWSQGNDLYQRLNDTCRYSPIVHSVFAPFSGLPPTAASTVWRLAESAMLLLALAWWLKSACPSSWNERQRAGLLLITIPLMMGNLNSGQSNAVVMAGILTCLAALNQQRWSVAALALAVSCHIKIYPLSLALLLIVVYPRQFTPRFVLALAAGALLPFLLKDPAYAVRQYGRWMDNLATDDRSGWSLVHGYRDGWTLVRAVGLPISFTAYRLFAAAMGSLIGLLVIALRRRGDDGPEFLNRVLGLGCCWMTLFGPATEGHTYILLSATVAWLAIEAGHGALPDWARRSAYFSVGIFLGMVIVAMSPLVHSTASVIWMPLAALVMLGTLVRLAVAHPVHQATTTEPRLDYRSSPQIRESAA
jgi:hypothetical protein